MQFICLLVFKSKNSGMTLPQLSVRPQVKKEMRTDVYLLLWEVFNCSFLYEQLHAHPTITSHRRGREVWVTHSLWEAGFADEQVIAIAKVLSSGYDVNSLHVSTGHDLINTAR